MGEKELKTEQAIINRFQELRQELSVLSGRANELASESHEHDLVLKALEPMDGDRKCYRVVGCPDPCLIAKIAQNGLSRVYQLCATQEESGVKVSLCA